MKFEIMRKKSLVYLFFFLFTLAGTAQTSNLYYNLDKGFKANLQQMNATLSRLEGVVNLDKRSRMKHYAAILKGETTVLIAEIELAYNQAQRITDKLENNKNYKLAEEVRELKARIYDMKYSANALSKYCGYMMKKPRVHGIKSFRSMTRIYNNIIKNRNYVNKNRKVLLKVISWEASLKI